jgi:hypothetical protein
MKKIVPLIIMAFMLSNCSENDGGIDCALFDPGFPSLYVRLIDQNGDNLIGNGTIDPNEIILLKGLGFRYNPPNEFAVPDSDIRKFDNTIKLYIPNESTFQYIIKLSETDVVTLDISAQRKNIPCDLFYYIPTGILQNNKELQIEEVFTLEFIAKITI